MLSIQIIVKKKKINMLSIQVVVNACIWQTKNCHMSLHSLHVNAYQDLEMKIGRDLSYEACYII